MYTYVYEFYTQVLRVLNIIKVTREEDCCCNIQTKMEVSVTNSSFYTSVVCVCMGYRLCIFIYRYIVCVCIMVTRSIVVSNIQTKMEVSVTNSVFIYW